MGMTNGQLELVGAIFQKLGKTTDPIPRWQMALRLRKLSEYMSALSEGKKPPEIVGQLMKKRQAVYDKYGMLMGDDLKGMRRYSIPQDKQTEVAAEVLAIEIENADAVEAENAYVVAVRELLKEKVDIEIDPIDYEWCGNLIDANEVTVLMELGLINSPKEDKQTKKR
jgi:hypothetical protein